MPSLTTSIRRAAEQATLVLPFRIADKEWFTLREAGAVLGLSESTAEKLYDRGELTGHSHNAGDGLRTHKRVLRLSLISYAIRTADYTDDMLIRSLVDELHGCLRHLPREMLIETSQAALRFAADAPKKFCVAQSGNAPAKRAGNF